MKAGILTSTGALTLSWFFVIVFTMHVLSGIMDWTRTVNPKYSVFGPSAGENHKENKIISLLFAIPWFGTKEFINKKKKQTGKSTGKYGTKNKVLKELLLFVHLWAKNKEK